MNPLEKRPESSAPNEEPAYQQGDLVQLRAALDDLPAYRPGRSVARPGGTGQHMFKVSSNENPFPPLPGVLEAAVAAAGSMNRYPDMFATELISALAKHFEVPVEHIATGTGSVGVLQQIVQATAAAGDEVIYAWRSFEAYPIVVGISGARSVRVPLKADARHDLDAMADAITDRTRLVLVCSPNNPTGPVASHEEMTEFLRRVPANVLVVVDEAYTEFVRDAAAVNGIDLYRNHPNVCVLRTFSKAYGLAGLRVGFAIAHDDVANALRKTAVPFGVSTVAQHAAVESLRREAELFERVEAVVAERTRVWSALRALGWDIPRSEANFVWFELGVRTAGFARLCEEAGLLVRPFADEGCRVTIAEAEANDKLVDVARSWQFHDHS